MTYFDDQGRLRTNSGRPLTEADKEALRVMKIHADDCPALKAVAHWADMASTYYAMGVCTCTAQADLAELVAAAAYLLDNDYLRGIDEANAWQRLEDALQPFREEKPDCKGGSMKKGLGSILFLAAILILPPLNL